MSENISYVTVAIALPVYETYIYCVPEHFIALVLPGKRVLIPFGKRRVTGYVLNFCEKPKKFKVKNILDVLDKISLFPSIMLPFFQWIADYYLYPIGKVIQTALPSDINVYDVSYASITKQGKDFILQSKSPPVEQQILLFLEKEACPVKSIEKKVNLNIPNALIYSLEKRGLIKIQKELKKGRNKQKMEKHVSIADNYCLDKKISVKRKAILDMVKDQGEIAVTLLKKSFPTALRLVKLLEKDGYVSVVEKKVYRDPFGDIIKSDSPPVLLQEQNKVVNDVINCLGKGYKCWLLAGVTGSGKTEVYMQIAMKVIQNGFTALVLVPEISLISQTAHRFRARFGEKVAVLHSALTNGERYDQWMRIVNGEVDVVIGARSAIFAPIKKIGVIIVDEEHDTSYKQDHGLHYNARDMAVIRAKQINCVCLFGSATPSVQSYFNTLDNKYSLLELKNRVNKQAMPNILVVDLKKYKSKRGVERYITSELYEKIKLTLNRGEQVLLFLNRRGFANFPVCSDCGESIKCKYCDVTLTMHKKEGSFRCHFCGFSIPSTSRCLSCKCGDIILLGMGTEKIQEAVIKLFPEAEVARLDYDTTVKKGSMLKILKRIRERKIDIIVGTQMVAKGHDFPDITLVGIICADLSLNFPDFRAGEKTFQLLAQVSGRAGRGKRLGQIIMQTYNPEHFSIMAAQNHDFIQFYNREIIFRQALSYPPFTRIIQLKISGKNQQETKMYAIYAGEQCDNLLKSDGNFKTHVTVLGPVEASIVKVANYFRWQLLIKSQYSSILHNFIKKLIFNGDVKLNNRNVRVIIDVDPFFMM